MTVLVSDSQVVGETTSALWSTIQQGPISIQANIKNSGVNTMNYRFQQFNGVSWVDLDVPGTPLNNTLQPNEVQPVTIVSTYPQVQMVGNASGGAILEFAVLRYYNRSSGGAIPMLSI